MNGNNILTRYENLTSALSKLRKLKEILNFDPYIMNDRNLRKRVVRCTV